MATYFERTLERQQERQRSNPYLDLSKQILTPEGSLVEAQDALRVRELLLEDRRGTPFWGDDPGLYDTVTFAKTIRLPGICKVRGKAFSQKIQRDSAPGTHGSSVKQLGRRECKIEIRVQMWTREHLEAFERLVPLLKSQRYTKTEEEQGNSSGFSIEGGSVGFSVEGGSSGSRSRSVHVGPAPIDVYHPLLALFKIRTVHILEVGFPEMNRGEDVWEVDIDCEEYIANRQTAVLTANRPIEFTEKELGPTAGTLHYGNRSAAKKPSDFVSEPNFGLGSGDLYE